MINAGVIPADIVKPCSGAPTGLTPCPTHPWGRELTVGSQSGWGGAPLSNRKFEIVFWGLTKSTCLPLMASVLESASINRLVWIYSDGGGKTDVTKLTMPSSAPLSSCDKNVVFQFLL
jgi:hypothetical protein